MIEQLVIAAPALLLSLSVHEYGHAWVATKLGDPTPARQGRLTLSPLAHIDPFGTIIFPGLLMLLNAGAIFGWAKPVPFSPINFTRKVTLWQGAALTASAGPLSNILLALMSVVLLRVGLEIQLTPSHILMRFAVIMFHLNILLAVFNLIPLPPLDGSYFIPRSMSQVKDFLARNALWILPAVFFLPPHRPVGTMIIAPLRLLLERILWNVVSIGT